MLICMQGQRDPLVSFVFKKVTSSQEMCDIIVTFGVYQVYKKNNCGLTTKIVTGP